MPFGAPMSRSTANADDVTPKLILSAQPSTYPFFIHNISWLFKLPEFISVFFERFQIIFPIIHQPSFNAASVPEPLLKAVACVGARFSDNEEAYHAISLALLEDGLQSLYTYVSLSHSTPAPHPPGVLPPRLSK